MGVSRCGKFAAVTNVSSIWEVLFAIAKVKARSIVIASAALLAGATSIEVSRKREGRKEGWLEAIGFLCLGLVTASVGIVAVARAAMRRSRGDLVVDFLKGNESAQEYCARLSKARATREGSLFAWWVIGDR